MIKRADNPWQERFMFAFDHALPAIGAHTPNELAVGATGLITCATDANMADSDYITIGDGINPPVLYEYDKGADGVTAGRVNWAKGASTAADVAATLKTAINANQPLLTVTDNLDGTLTLANKLGGTFGNVTITENVAHATFTVAGMSAGTNAVAASVAASTFSESATRTIQLFTAQRKMRIEKVEYINVVGLAEHADNYWEIDLLKDATSMAQWSTDEDADGTLTADTFVDLNLSATKADLVADVGDVFSLALTKVASAANLPPGRIVVHGRYVS